MKLFSKYSNLCENHTSMSQTDGQTDDLLSHNRVLCSIAWKKYKSFWLIKAQAPRNARKYF